MMEYWTLWLWSAEIACWLTLVIPIVYVAVNRREMRKRVLYVITTFISAWAVPTLFVFAVVLPCIWASGKLRRAIALNPLEETVVLQAIYPFVQWFEKYNFLLIAFGVPYVACLLSAVLAVVIGRRFAASGREPRYVVLDSTKPNP